jgi:hypothetical protein
MRDECRTTGHVLQTPFPRAPPLDNLLRNAGVAELADALDSKSSARKGVEVQVLSPVLGNAVLFAPRFSCAMGVSTKVSTNDAKDAEQSAGSITIDLIAKIVLDKTQQGRLSNEIQVLSGWATGLYFLYRQTRLMEEYSWAQISAEMKGDGQRPETPTELALPSLSCAFQWYAVTLCNFVELIGAIGWELNSSRKPPREYIKEVIPAVLEYRNKVGAHVGRARRNAANPAEQLLSMLPPSSLENGRYFAGSWATHIRRSGTSSAGTLTRWSLTETHEQLAERYWPAMKRV